MHALPPTSFATADIAADVGLRIETAAAILATVMVGEAVLVAVVALAPEHTAAALARRLANMVSSNRLCSHDVTCGTREHFASSAAFPSRRCPMRRSLTSSLPF